MLRKGLRIFGYGCGGLVIVLAFLLGFGLSGRPPVEPIPKIRGVHDLPIFFPGMGNGMLYYLTFNAARMRSDGINLVSFPYMVDAKSGRLKEFPLMEGLIVYTVQAAHRNGFRVFLMPMIVPWPPPPGSNPDQLLEDLEPVVQKTAAIAQKYGVEYYSPLNEADLLGVERASKWGQGLLPTLRDRYTGKLVWKLMGSGLSPQADIDFSGYDFLAVSIFPPYESLEQLREFTRSVLDRAVEEAAADGLTGGVLIGEFGAPTQEVPGVPNPSGRVVDKALQAEIVRVILEESRDKTVGTIYGAWGFPGFGIKGKPGETVIKEWYGNN